MGEDYERHDDFSGRKWCKINFIMFSLTLVSSFSLWLIFLSFFFPQLIVKRAIS